MGDKISRKKSLMVKQEKLISALNGAKNITFIFGKIEDREDSIMLALALQHIENNSTSFLIANDDTIIDERFNDNCFLLSNNDIASPDSIIKKDAILEKTFSKTDLIILYKVNSDVWLTPKMREQLICKKIVVLNCEGGANDNDYLSVAKEDFCCLIDNLYISPATNKHKCIAEDVFYDIYDTIDNMTNFSRSYFPTVEELKRHNLLSNIDYYLIFLMYLSTNAILDTLEGEYEKKECKRTIDYINKFLRENLIIV